MPRKPDLSKRELILNAAEKVFGEKGFHMATLDEIAQKAGVAKGTIYLYFQDKFDLFLSAIERDMERFAARLERIRDDTDDPLEAVNLIIDAQLDFARSTEKLVRQMTPDKFRPPSDRLARKTRMMMVREKVFKPAMRALNVISQCIEEGQERGVFRREIDPKVSALVLTSMIRGVVFSRIILPELGIDDEGGFSDVKTIFLNGIKRGVNDEGD